VVAEANDANEEQRAYWNREEARNWVTYQPRYDAMLEPYGNAMLDAAAIEPGHRVLDIGCGNGMTTREAARQAREGSAHGVDLSEAMLERARELAAQEGLENVTFEEADAQTRPFEPEFDRVISRFGVMFFDDQVKAFANIRSALRPGGQVSFVVWQELLLNDWLTVPGAVALQYVEVPEGNPDEPGPFALRDPDRVRSIFVEAGFNDLKIEPFQAAPIFGGRTLDDAVEFLAQIPVWAGMFEEAPEETKEKALDSAREAFEPYLTPDGVRLGGSAWIITAHR
jgi:SAM-dependent methyltransferase